MDFFVVANPVLGPVEFGTLTWMSVVALATALVPLCLAARQVLGFGTAEQERPPLHIIEGARELSQRAA